MNRLHLEKRTDSLATFLEGQRLFAGSSYDVRVDAREFVEDTTSSATLSLCSGPFRLATCSLVPDPLRRGARTAAAPLAIPSYRETSSVDLRVELAGSTILLVGVTLAGDATSASPEDPASSSSRWTVVDAGLLSSPSLTLADMTQVKAVATPVDSPLSITPAGDALDVFLVVTVPGESPAGFPFTGVLVGGVAPVWSHQDSFMLPARKWMLHVTKVADDYYADLRAGLPGGTEVDPDGAVVVSAEVNS